MFGNTIGKAFRVTTWGESHGVAIGCLIDGCPPGLPLHEDDIQPDLERRRPGKTRHTTQRRETDAVRILSGVFEGATTGTPIHLMIENVDQRARDYSKIKDVYRPSHAGYTYMRIGCRCPRRQGQSKDVVENRDARDDVVRNRFECLAASGAAIGAAPGRGDFGSLEDGDRRTASQGEFRSEISLDATAGRGLRFARFGPTTPGRCEDMSTSPVHALDAAHYTDATRFERERERIFRRTWQFAGHVSQLEHPGDCFALDLHGRSLFCVKDRGGVVRAFYNACRHRAHQLVEGSGRKRALVCPYHAWTYELDGRLRAAPGAGATPGFDRSEIRLTPVRSEIVGGFVFVNLDPDAEPMDTWYPGLAHALDYTSWFLWPTFSFQVYPGNVLNTYIWHAVDHRTTRVIRQWFAPDGVEPELIVSLAEQDLGTTVAEDVRLVESVQRGLESGGYRPAPLIIDPAGGVNSEHSIRVLYEWLGEAMA